MPLNRRQLVKIESTFRDEGGRERYKHGTGYFVTAELVLTAWHVLEEGAPHRVKVRVEEGEPVWRDADTEPVWTDEQLDSVLIKVSEPLPETPEVNWGDRPFEADAQWTSTAYPIGSSQRTDQGREWRSSGLTGTLYAQGGGGQGIRDLELGVNDPPGGDSWQGISGAPVFVGDSLVGIIRSFPPDFEARRLAAVPIELLLANPHFRLAIAPQWIRTHRQETWFLLLSSGSDDRSPVIASENAIRMRADEIERITDRPVAREPVTINVNEVLQSPERWLQFVKAICEAPVMIVDVTDFQPATMMLLGVRSVVQRGVTVAVTSNRLEESDLGLLPFNIQETKLIGPGHLNEISKAVKEGLVQVENYAGYLDLPAFDAVRCPEPKRFQGGSNPAQEVVLMLCSFHGEYARHWEYVREQIQLLAYNRGVIPAVDDEDTPTVVRMLDISSPRLVGLALYEHIRWTPCCVVDWTHWRPNVFFELGVRLACSETGAIHLIEQNEKPDAQSEGASELDEQKRLLIELFSPIDYGLGGPNRPFTEAFDRYSEINSPQETTTSHAGLRHNDTYRVIVQSYDWRREPFMRPPHEELRRGVESLMGEDPQRVGRSQVLFSSNAQFIQELRRSAQERWIAAWFYLRNRYTTGEVQSDLETLGDEVLQALEGTQDPDLRRIRTEIEEFLYGPQDAESTEDSEASQ